MDNVTMNMTQWLEMLTTLNRIANAIEIIAYNQSNPKVEDENPYKFTTGCTTNSHDSTSTEKKTFFEMYK